MNRKCVWSVCFLILLCFSSLSAFAQSQSSVRGELGGAVVDASRAVVVGATVSLSGPTGNTSVMTDAQGVFLFTSLIPGFYSVKVEKTGFKSASVQDVEVQINKTAQLQVQLEVGTVTETVEVVATAVAVENTSTSVNADISDDVYKNLPIGRNIANVFYLSPGVVSGLGTGQENPGISGSTGLENAYVADGVLLNDAAFGGMGIYSRSYGSIGVGINGSFVQEVQVKTAGFEPQYGHATGGVVTMVTKSGSSAFHGVIGGYFQSKGMGALYANNDDFHPLNLVGRQLKKGTREGDFELGGYVPLGRLKDHLFFFGAFNPTWNQSWVAPAVNTARFAATGGEIERKTRIWDYSAKLTWQLNAKHRIESSVFGDPSLTNSTAWQALNIDNNSADSILDYGGRSWATRYDGTLGADWIVSGNFSWNWNRFLEDPTTNIPRIQDLTQTAGFTDPVTGQKQRGSFRTQGLGFFENYDSNTKALAFDTSKGFTIGGHHTFSAGYYWQFPTYVDANGYSGARYAIPTTNHDGNSYLSAAQLALVQGQQSDAYFRLLLASSVTGSGPTCTLCPFMAVPGYASPQHVVLYQYRGIFSSGLSDNTSKYHAAYVNDSWQMGNHVTLNLGVRWEQERLSAGGVHDVMNDQWSPRVGFSVDPKGDRKTKIYANFGRYAWYMPLDAAIRELTVESDYRKAYFAPVADASNNVVLNSYGTVTVQPDAAHLLNKAVGGINKGVVASSVSGEVFNPGTRMEYNDEFVVGAEHEFRGGITVSARYIDRRLKRIIEDFGPVSIEGNNAGFGQYYAIGNPDSKFDVAVNAKEIAFSQGATFTAGPNNALGQPTGYPAGCYDSNGYLATVDLNETDTFGNILGSVCFPSVNMNPWTDSSGNNLAGALFGGEFGADGQPDGYSDPKREYQAVEFEINKSFSHNWSLLSNYRIARLRGNFEGAFRNDNGQSDPGISSLFDFVPGVLGTLGKQFAIGPLNSDQLHVVNIYPSYTFDRGPKGLVVSPGVKIATGVPLTTLAAQSAYLNPGEVPIFGRGDLGRLPATGTVDVHVEYPRKISESKILSVALDFFNIANSKRPVQLAQFADLSFGTPNVDFKKPGNAPPDNLVDQLTAGFVQPFSMRIGVQFKF